MLRPGTEYIDSTLNNAAAIHIPFIFSNSDAAIIELTDETMRVRVDEEIIERPSVTAEVTNGDFLTDLTGWTDADESGATSQWFAGGYMGFIGTNFNAAIRTQEVTVNEPGIEHALRVEVTQGPVYIRVGSFSGGEDYVGEVKMRTGFYSFAFTPTDNFFIYIFGRAEYQTLVKSIEVEASGGMEIPTPWDVDSLSLLRWDQSGDVIFVACNGFEQKRIERYATRSWAVVDYVVDDGPYRLPNTGFIRLTPSGLSGNVQVSASAALFRAGHVGALFRMTSIGQNVEIDVSGGGQWSDAIRVTGVGGSRAFTVTRAGTWTATVTLQRSIGEEGAWEDSGTIYTTNGTSTVNDGQDNQIIYYRIGVDVGDFTSGPVELSMAYSSGGLVGTFRVVNVLSSTLCEAIVLDHLGAVSPTDSWEEGAWSEYRGFPTSIALAEGRLWWAGRDNVWGSISDAYESFDDTQEGDSGPISKIIGSGPVDIINWILPLLRLILGGQGAEHSVRSSAIDTPLTPSDFSIKQPSTQGSAPIPPAKVDMGGIFVDKSATRVYALAMEDAYYSYDYSSKDLTIYCPEIGEAGFTRIAVQRRPETRIHCLRADGTAAVLVYDPLEEVQAWIPVETDGEIEDVFVLPSPNSLEDKVYYLVRRTVELLPVRYLERWAKETECRGGTLSKNIDSHVVYQGAATNTITGLDHLEDKEVVIWGDGADLGTATVSGGSITLDDEVENAVVGLPYTAQFKSTKLAYAAQGGTALTQIKKVNRLGVIMNDTHYQGLRYGRDLDNLQNLPEVVDGKVTPADTVWGHFDKKAFMFPGSWDTDSRICLEAASPRPCTLLAAVIDVETHDRI